MVRRVWDMQLMKEVPQALFLQTQVGALNVCTQ